MYYNKTESEKIRDLSFYCMLDYLDETNHFQNAERNMKIERIQYLSEYGGFEKWKELRDRYNDKKIYQTKKN